MYWEVLKGPVTMHEGAFRGIVRTVCMCTNVFRQQTKQRGLDYNSNMALSISLHE